jgi:hypothetical protein
MMEIESAVAKMLNTRNDPAGILKCGPRCLFMVRAWRTVRLLIIAIVVLNKIPLDHSGMILIRVLRSSTSSTVHSHRELE